MNNPNHKDAKTTLSLDVEFPSRSIFAIAAEALCDLPSLGISWLKYFCLSWTLLTAICVLSSPEGSATLLSEWGKHLIIWTGILSLTLACAERIKDYWGRAPVGLEHLPNHVRQIAHLRPKKWESKFAQSLLAIACRPIERAYIGLENGTVVVPARSIPSMEKYLEWVDDRIESEKRMLNVALKLFAERLPEAISSSATRKAEPLDIIDSVEEIRQYFLSAYGYERDVYAVVPPTQAAKCHDLLKGRSIEFRTKIHEAFHNLKKIEEIHPDSNETTVIDVRFNSPVNSDALLEELSRLRRDVVA